MITATAMPAWVDYREALFAREGLEFWPIRAWELKVAIALFERDYPVETARKILDFASDMGTVECCGHVHDRHREDLERLLPESPVGSWVYYDRWTWRPAEV